MTLFRRKTTYESDAQMVAALMRDDEAAVCYVFYDHYDLLLRHNARKACQGRTVDYDDLRQELYLYLCADNWRRLRRYDPQMPFECWFSVVSYRFFKDYTKGMVVSDEMPQNDEVPSIADQEFSTIAGIDLRDALARVESLRDRDILRALLIDDEDPAAVAVRHDITVDNLYNVKRRAIARLIQQTLGEYKW